MACTERARLHGGGGRQQVRGWLRSPGRREGERGASRRCEGIRGAGERRRRSAPVPRVASEGHPRAQSLVVHRSLRQVRAGRGEELSSPASLRGVREINEADLYTIQFIAWKEGGGEMPLVPPRPLRPRKTIRGCRSLSRSAPRRSVVPLQRPLLLNVPSKLTRSIAGEGAGGGGQGVRGWQLLRCESSLPSAPLIISEMLLFSKQRGGSGVRRGCGGGARGPPRRAGHRTLRGAERGSGAIPAIPGEAARIHSELKPRGNSNL